MKASHPSFAFGIALLLTGVACGCGDATSQQPPQVPESNGPPATTAAATAQTDAPPAAAAAATATPAAAGLEGFVANNKALADAVKGIWTPDASGSIPASAHTTLEKELLRSVLYVQRAAEPPMHDGRLMVYTDEASLHAVAGQRALVIASSPAAVLKLALGLNAGIHLQYEGDASVFATFDEDEIRKLLARAKPAAP